MTQSTGSSGRDTTGTTATGTGTGTAGPARPAARAVAGTGENLRFLATHTLPTFARGFINPRPRMVRASAALRQPEWSAATLRSLRDRHGGAPVLLRGLSGPLLVLLDEPELRQFYSASVRDLAMDAPDKNAGLTVLEPSGVICSHGELREDRRRINHASLAAGDTVHPCAKEFLAVVAEEARSLTARAVLDAPEIQRSLSRMCRRIVLGDAAADDDRLTAWLSALRSEANWLGRRRKQARAARVLYARADARIAEYAAVAPAHTLGARALTRSDPDGVLDRIGQTHHWMLALDGLAPVVARTLLLLAAHPAEQDAVLGEAAADGRDMPRLRACVQESLRLFPLVPDLVRVTRAQTTWRGVPHPAGTAVLVPALFHGRDRDHVPAADLFAPGRWLAPEAAADLRLAPFGHGAAACPGANLGMLLSTAVCAEVLRRHRLAGARPTLPAAGPLPRIVDTPGIRLRLEPR
ncbi:cytochrome P450 [Streptomyces sp. NPDC046866]|uniref:cytochrome P450 n=1 Tax=Streptomyces sp. NPDC046866 TaxID=3154921 RepID=UPI0034570906